MEPLEYNSTLFGPSRVLALLFFSFSRALCGIWDNGDGLKVTAPWIQCIARHLSVFSDGCWLNNLCMALVFIKYSNCNLLLIVTLFFDVDVWTSNSGIRIWKAERAARLRHHLNSIHGNVPTCRQVSRVPTHERSESPLARKTVSAWTLGSSTILF